LYPQEIGSTGRHNTHAKTDGFAMLVLQKHLVGSTAVISQDPFYSVYSYWQDEQECVAAFSHKQVEFITFFEATLI